MFTVDAPKGDKVRASAFPLPLPVNDRAMAVTVWETLASYRNSKEVETLPDDMVRARICSKIPLVE